MNEVIGFGMMRTNLIVLVVAYSDNTCSSVNSIVYDVTGRCGTFGPNKPIFSARAVGTCQ